MLPALVQYWLSFKKFYFWICFIPQGLRENEFKRIRFALSGGTAMSEQQDYAFTINVPSTHRSFQKVSHLVMIEFTTVVTDSKLLTGRLPNSERQPCFLKVTPISCVGSLCGKCYFSFSDVLWKNINGVPIFCNNKYLILGHCIHGRTVSVIDKQAHLPSFLAPALPESIRSPQLLEELQTFLLHKPEENVTLVSNTAF